MAIDKDRQRESTKLRVRRFREKKRREKAVTPDRPAGFKSLTRYPEAKRQRQLIFVGGRWMVI
jgi:hypothetical protein